MEVDRYEVERMIRDSHEVGELRSRCNDLERELQELRQDIGTERVDRQDADERLGRVIDSRTAHLA